MSRSGVLSGKSTIVHGGVASSVLRTSLSMSYVHLGLDCVSVIRNGEVSLIQRSSKYTFLWLTVWDR